MEIFKHYSKGTVIIDSEGNYTGYYPDRNETLLNVHIKHNTFNIYIYSDAIAIYHKNLSMVYEHSFRVGRWQYCIDALQQYKKNERNMLLHMDATLRELVYQHSVEGIPINDYYSIQLINTHRVNQD